MINFGEALTKAQKQQGVTTKDLSQRLGVHRQQLEGWRKHTDIKLSTAVKIADALGLDIFELMELGK